MLRRADTCHDNLTSGAPLPRADKKTGTLSHRLRSVRGAEAASSWMLTPCIRRRPCRRTDFSPDAARFHPPPRHREPPLLNIDRRSPPSSRRAVSPARLPLNLRPGLHASAMLPLPSPLALPPARRGSPADFAAAAASSARPSFSAPPVSSAASAPRRQKKRRPGIGKLRHGTALSVTVTLR